MTREEHLLTIAAEECAKTAALLSKANRFAVSTLESRPHQVEVL